MSIPRARPVDALQQIMTTFKQFEKKLDKLQDDVNFHGHTLSELHVMLANISGSNLLNNTNDAKLEDAKRFVSKTTAMHYENQLSNDKGKMKRKNAQQLIPRVAKSSQMDKYGIKTNNPPNSRLNKALSSPKYSLAGKRQARPRKGEAPRKGTLRKKDTDKRRVQSPDIIF